MKRIFNSFLFIFAMVLFSFAQTKTDMQQKNGSNQKQVKVDSKNEEKGVNKVVGNVRNNVKNTKSNYKKKPLKKPTKKDKYIFKKEEQNIYKFDEKGNPIVRHQIKKTTETRKDNTFKIGIEEKSLKIKDK